MPGAERGCKIAVAAQRAKGRLVRREEVHVLDLQRSYGEALVLVLAEHGVAASHAGAQGLAGTADDRVVVLVGDAQIALDRRKSVDEVVAAVKRADPRGHEATRDQTATRRASDLDLLSPRERAVLQGLVDGRSGDAIAELLQISPHTVRTHVQNLLGKLGATSRLEAAGIAFDAGMRPSSTEVRV
jgi:DNA-binding NarL/FixJ family response regulator